MSVRVGDRELSYQDLAALPGQVTVPGKGEGVLVSSVLAALGVTGARELELTSSDGSFHATVALAEVAGAVLLYREGGAPLPASKGGPVRFFAPHLGECKPGHDHACANVKGLGEIRVHG